MIKRTLTALVVGVIVSLPFSAVAYAEPSSPTLPYTCVEPVVDETNNHVLDRDVVSAAVAKLEDSTGANVYVRAYQNTPEGNAAAWWKKEWTSCPSLSSPDGKYPSPNIVVIEFGLDRTSAIAYGSNWNSTLDNVVDNIRANELNRGLKSGHYTTAITASLDKLDTAMHGTDPYAIDIDWNGVGHVLGIVFMWVVGIAILIAVIWGLVLAVQVFNNARREHARTQRLLEESLARLEASKTSASASVSDVDPEQLKNEFSITVSRLPEKETVDLRKRFDSAIEDIMEWSGKYAELNSLPDPKETRSVHYRSDEFNNVSMGIKAAVAEIHDLVSEIELEVTRRSPKGIRADLDVAIRNVGIALTSLSSIVSKGYRSDKLVRDAKSLHEEILDIPLDSLASEREHVDALIERVNTVYDKVRRDASRVDSMSNAEGVLRSALANARDVAANARTDNKVVARQSDTIRKLGSEIDVFLQDRDGFGAVTPRWEQFTKLRGRIGECVDRIKSENSRLDDIDANKAAAERRAKEKLENEERIRKARERNRRNGYSSVDQYGTGFGTGYVFGSGSSSSSHHSSGSGGGSFGSFGGGFGGGGFSGGSW